MKATPTYTRPKDNPKLPLAFTTSLRYPPLLVYVTENDELTIHPSTPKTVFYVTKNPQTYTPPAHSVTIQHTRVNLET